jgi:fatty acid desaturase
MQGRQIENCVTVIATAALVLGAMALGAGGHSWWGLLLLLNLNYTKKAAAKEGAQQG